VAVVSKKILQRWVDVFDGGEVKYCIPDVFTLAHTPDKWTVSYQADYACVRTGKYSGFAGSVDWVDAILATQAGMELDIHREEVLVSQALEQQDIGQSKSPDLLAGINLLQGSFKPKRNNNSAAIKSWLPLVLAPALVMILFITNMLVESYQFNHTASAYRESSARDFQRLFGTEIDGGSGVLRQEAEYLQRYAQHKDKQLSGGVSGLLQLADKEVSRCVACNLVSLRAQELSLELIFSTVGSDFEAKLSTLPSLIVESKKVGENTVVRIMREAG
jgi:type II secretory pathway component PulL